MAAVAIALALYLAFWLLGAATISLRTTESIGATDVLCSPIIGACVLVLAVLVLSASGLAILDFAIPLLAIAVAGSVAVLARTRPHLDRYVIASGVVAFLPLVLMSMPMLDFGLRWIGNANDDMALYALSATRLLHKGYNSSLDVGALLSGKDLAEAMWGFHAGGIRPGTDLLLGLTSAISGREPLEVAMPAITAVQMAATCAVGALALQARDARLAAPIAALLYGVSPMATYGLEQQLLPQAWGLGIAAALAALVMRRDAYAGRRPVLAAAILAAGVVVVYVDMAPVVAGAYALFVVAALLRKAVPFRAMARFWAPAAVLGAILASPYIWRAATYLEMQVRGRFTGSYDAASSLFAYMLTPNVIPGAVGIRPMIPPYQGSNLTLWIVLGFIGLLLVAAFGVMSAWRWEPAGFFVVSMLGLLVLLGAKPDDFGLFKLTMWAAPFVAACIASFAARTRFGLAAVVVLIALWWSPQREYVSQARDPADVPSASSSQLLPELRASVDEHPGPFVSTSDSVVVNDWIASVTRGHPTQLLSRDRIVGLLKSGPALSSTAKKERDAYVARDPWRSAQLPLGDGRALHFRRNAAADALLAAPGCRLLVPGASTSVFNREAHWRSTDPLIDLPCGEPHNALAFIQSGEGRNYLLSSGTPAQVSFWQLEPDPARFATSFTAAGRYALFRVLNPSDRVRVVLDLTTSYQPRDTALPDVSVIGRDRRVMPIEGIGSARAASPPLAPAIIDGEAYVAIDLGRDPEILGAGRSGLAGLFNKDIRLDRRFGVARVRGITAIGNTDYAQRTAPTAVEIPKGLADEAVEYSGIAEDGWMLDEAWVRLDAPAGSVALVKGEVPRGVSPGCRIAVTVGERTVERAIAPGAFSVTGPRVATAGSREVAVSFTCSRTLPPPDLRNASAHLTQVAFLRRSASGP